MEGKYRRGSTGGSRREKKRKACPVRWGAVGLLAAAALLFAFKLPVADWLAVSSSATTVPADETAPEILGVKDLIVYAGDTVSYRKDVDVIDNRDQGLELQVDSTGVDLSTPGEYSVIYSAVDSAGNKTEIQATVTVLQTQEAREPVDAADEKADQILQTLIQPGMSVEDQVEAIYDWMQDNCRYSNASEHTDWRQAGYEMLIERRGDCFGYFGASKLMFERLGIPNIDVTKVPQSQEDSQHFWSLVSVDGGNTYYHFDCTPRLNQADLCLITDQALDAYSRENGGSHNRDTSLYPTTPEE